MSIALNKIGKVIAGRTLFEDVSVIFNAGNHYGLTGPNGAGKSTLLKIITGSVEATTGSVALPRRVGILKQNIEQFESFTALECVIMGNKRLWEARQQQEALYLEEIDDAKGMLLAELEEIIAEEDGYVAETEAEDLLNGIGMSADLHGRTMKTLPLDLQFRALLCQSLFGKPEALLLDEPTNHLDLVSIGWLEKFLKSYNGTLIVVSHDRHFLNQVTTHIADIDYDTLMIYPGNYDQMVVTKMAARERQEADTKSKEKKIAQLQDFVSKFGAGTRASQVQSRIREIGRLQPQDLKKSNIQRPYIRFIPSEKNSGKLVFSLQNVTKSYADNTVLKDVCLEIEQGEKIGIIGNNGIGKTTLVKLLTGTLTPDSGVMKQGHQTLISYFPQNHSDLIANSLNDTLFEWLRSCKGGIYDQDVRSVLGKMLFSGDDAFKKVKDLSGGETARLIMAGILLQEHNTLIFDEPNNHLDLEAVSALSWGIQDYKGTVIFVSHDRSFMEECADKIIVFDQPLQPRKFEGSLNQYFEKQGK
ncbi:putative ABC transporter ATP-binding protein YbiT [Candidatus Clavichlamydia salmonicola]|uniref:ABC-F family ATP-binding cassette domain-containing protein n=1 Tax=Candidatus Clavichlamydia salmonicola TaxID=469812 RepID=UPI001891AFE4|nr:ABC-F family ATP-binding cassette domain-containing protein [Candidatus Clavichlamydia salmonicola]MBF5050942.1 putative ABC transporter ATP-binding protein YbiT [Candidatus Clavichlamydia salmonicola]